MIASGTRLGPYEVLAAIGAGGMGEVYRARDTRLDRIVAVKVLPESLAADPQFRERFDREAKAISALEHPHICALYDVGEQSPSTGSGPTVAYLVMQYLEGETLESRLSKGALPLDRALEYATQIADALDKAHRAGIVHRDLKPGNIMLTKTGAKLLDFGLAKATAPAGSAAGLSMLPTTPANLTAQGTILGTFRYMAPEQLEGREADARTDIFAFGAVLYEILTGKKAFDAKSQASLIGAIMQAELPPIATVQPLVPPLLDHLVARCLAKNPDDRWQSARDMLHELRWIASGVTDGVVTAKRQGRADAARWAIAGSGVLVGAALAAASLFWYLRPPAPDQPAVTQFDLVTPATNDPFSFALSADGRQIAFVASSETGPRLWIRPLDQIAARVIAGTEGATQPFWSPDGRAIGFFADGKLKRVDVTSGALRVLADAPVPRGGTWNQDDVILFCPTVFTGVMCVPAGGGTATAVTERPVAGQGTHRWPRFLADGRRFVFLVALAEPETRGLYLGALGGEAPRRLLAADAAAIYAAPGYLLVPSQGALVAYRFDQARGSVMGEPITVAQSVGVDSGGVTGLGGFAVSANGVLAHRTGATARRQLVLVDRTGNQVGSVGPADDTALAVPELAPDGQRVALFRNVQSNPDVWLIEVGRATTSRFTFGPELEINPVWSPDSRRVVYASNRKGRWDLFEKQTDGGTDEQPLLVNAQDKSPQDWSRDGRFLLYAVQDSKTGSDLWALPLVGERKPFPVLQSPFDELHGKLSPDGRWLAYVSNETGRQEVYVRPFNGPGEKQRVSTGGGIYPRWREDGKELFYVTLDNRMMAVPIGARADSQTPTPGIAVALFQSPRLAVAGNNSISNWLARAPYAVTANGRFLLDVYAEDGGAVPITVVLNWTATQKK